MKKGWIIAGLVVGLAVVFPAAIPPLLGLITFALPGYILWVCLTEGGPGPSEEDLWLLNRRLTEGQKVGPGDKPPANWRRIVEEEEISICGNIWSEADVLFSHGSPAWRQYVDREVMLWKSELKRDDASKEEIQAPPDTLSPRDSGG